MYNVFKKEKLKKEQEFKDQNLEKKKQLDDTRKSIFD